MTKLLPNEFLPCVLRRCARLCFHNPLLLLSCWKEIQAESVALLVLMNLLPDWWNLYLGYYPWWRLRWDDFLEEDVAAVDNNANSLWTKLFFVFFNNIDTHFKLPADTPKSQTPDSKYSHSIPSYYWMLGLIFCCCNHYPHFCSNNWLWPKFKAIPLHSALLSHVVI